MAGNKTIENENSVIDFLHSIGDESKRHDCFRLVEIMKDQTGFEPRMWGTSIIGFGSYHYQYASGREGDAPIIACSPRKHEISLYLTMDTPLREKLLINFGKFKTGKACIYIKKLTDINKEILKYMIEASVDFVREKYPLLGH